MNNINNRTSKTLNLLDEAGDFKFAFGKWKILNDQPNANYDVKNWNYL